MKTKKVSALSPKERSLANLKEHAGRGRTPGVPNKVTKQVKEVIAQCFDDIGGCHAFAMWARKNRTEFYKLYGKLLPIQLQGAGSKGAFEIVISREESQL